MLQGKVRETMLFSGLDEAPSKSPCVNHCDPTEWSNRNSFGKYRIMYFELIKLVSTTKPKLPKTEAFVLSSTPRPSPSVWCNRDLRLQDRPCSSSCETRTFNFGLARIFCITPSSIGPPSDTSIVYIFCTCRNESLAGCLSGSLCLSSQHGDS